jgi:hypothetical protein
MSVFYGLRRPWGVLKHSIRPQWDQIAQCTKCQPLESFLAVGPSYIILGRQSMDPYLRDSGLMWGG